MITAQAFLSAAKEASVSFYTGVPCSFLTPLINRVISDPETDYVGAASEGEAVGIAAGAWLVGRGAAVMCQNSGLGNTINPLTSLNYPFRIPTLLIVTWRGGPGILDEPQHELMGRITPDLLDVIGIPHRSFPSDAENIRATLGEAAREMNISGLPFALIMEKDAVEEEGLNIMAQASRETGEYYDIRYRQSLPARVAVLEQLLEVLPDTAAVIATTGKCGRELFTLADRPQHLYQVGSMGCAAGMGLGVALNVQRSVVVLDGDGAALMKLGTLATIGACHPSNLLHVLLDNGVHDSTGGQPTVSPVVDFPGIALACGYRHVFSCDSVGGFKEAVMDSLKKQGPVFIHMRIAPGSLSELGRPTIRPQEVAQRFKAFLTTPVSETAYPRRSLSG